MHAEHGTFIDPHGGGDVFHLFEISAVRKHIRRDLFPGHDGEEPGDPAVIRIRIHGIRMIGVGSPAVKPPGWR